MAFHRLRKESSNTYLGFFKTMSRKAEYTPRVRAIRIIRSLLERPYGYTKVQLAEHYGVHPDTIKEALIAIQDAGFSIDKDKRHRYALTEDTPYRALESLLQFSKEDQDFIMDALDKAYPHHKRAEKLKRKLANLYDFTRINRTQLRRPYLSIVNRLESAQQQKWQITLYDYPSSNSNEIRDRMVEGFHVGLDEDILHAFDIERKALRHFRISRITKLKISDTPWQYEGHHVIRPTDPFRIVDSKQVFVRLRMRVGAYNELVERFPLAQAYTRPLDEGDQPEYEFQGMVNHRFFGLGNFILGFHHQIVEVEEPEGLIEYLLEQTKKIQENLGG